MVLDAADERSGECVLFCDSHDLTMKTLHRVQREGAAFFGAENNVIKAIGISMAH